MSLMKNLFIDLLKMYWLMDFLGLGEAVKRVGGV